jgi:hypothetical protein
MTQLFKKCPSCGHLNPETEIFCQNHACGGTDISLVQVESPVCSSALTPAAAVASSSRQVKICPKCGRENESFALLCGHTACGTMLDEVALGRVPAAAIPLADEASGERAPKRLWLLVGGQSFECRNGDVLGRKGTVACQVFAGIGTVSGQHVSLQLRGGQWQVVNLPLPPGRAGKNVTQLDGHEVEIGDSLPLTGEHVLKMSTQCEVRLCVTAGVSCP